MRSTSTWCWWAAAVLLAAAIRLPADDAAPAEANETAAAPAGESPAASAQAPATESTPAAKPLAELPIDQQPYRVLVALGVAADRELDGSDGGEIVQGLRDRIASRLGPLWEADVVTADWLSPGRRSVLEQYPEAVLTEKFLPGEYDKVFLATVESEGAGVRISAREWDRNSQTATASTSRLTFERRAVVDRLLAEILLHFRPIAAVESVSADGLTVELRIRGGELLPPDPELRPMQVGTYLRPYYRYLDRKKQLQQLQTIPWTYLQATEIDRGRMQGEVTSAFASVLAGNRRRTELMAIGVKLRYDETSLRLFPRGQPENPMAAARVDVLDRRPTADDAVDDRLTLYTDRFGDVRIPANSEQPLQYIYVLVGKGVLAMVPYISGEQPSAALDVPDDGPRLLVEGEIAIMEAELIELVARREVAMSRALGYARASRWEQADPLVEEIKRMPTRETLFERLERIRLPAVDLARRTRNRVGESRINQMCNQLKETIDKHLNPDRVRTFLQEVAELKQAG